MKAVRTEILEDAILVRYADDDDPTKAESWMEFRFPLAALARPNAGGTPLGDLENRFLEELYGAVLLRAQTAIAAEIRRLLQLRGL